jgi:hypothetical protein
MDVCLLCELCVVRERHIPYITVEVSATSHTDCGASLCVIKKPRGRGGHNPRWAAESEKLIMIISDAIAV